MKVLFVCHMNNSRSQMAKAFYESISGESADSAGVAANEFPSQTLIGYYDSYKNGKTGYTIQVMDEIGLDIRDFPRTQLTPEMLSQYDLIVDITDPDQKQDWLIGENVICWNVADVHGKSYERAVIAREGLRSRVENLVKVLNEGDDFRKLDEGAVA